MFKIGDFSGLTQVPVKTLRYYDEIGLLKPVEVDRFTGYRYYSASQLPRLNRILALKDLGFSLEDIGKALDENLPLDELRGMLRLRRAEQHNRVAEEQERLARVERRLTQIEKEGGVTNYEVVVKRLNAQWVASVRDVIPAYQDIGRLFGELYGYVARLGAAGVPGATWHDDGYKEQDVDAEAFVYLKGRVPETDRVKVRELAAADVASVVHKGAFIRLCDAYNAIMQWIEANGYSVAGPSREIYLHCPQPVRQDDESCVTEIQVPVEKT